MVTKSNRGRKYCYHEHYIAGQFGLEVLPIPKKEPKLTIPDEEMTEEAPEPVFEVSSEQNYIEEDKGKVVFPIRLAGQGEKLNPKRVFIVAGPSRFQGKYDQFASQVPVGAEEWMMNGDVFVFCNVRRTQLSILQWQEDGFALFFKRTEYDRYPWPDAENQELVEITPADLRLLLEIPLLLLRLQGTPTE